MTYRKQNDHSLFMNVMFCKDALSPEFGIEFYEILHDLFPEINLVYHKGIENFDYSDETQEQDYFEVDKSTFLELEWKRKSPDVAVFVQDSKDLPIRVAFVLPEEGGTKLFFDGHTGRAFIRKGSVQILFKRSTEYAMFYTMKNLLTKVGTLFESSYGYVSTFESVKWTNLGIQISGIYWLTYFGSDYVEMIGKDKFDTAPCHRISHLSDGGVILVLTEELEDSLTLRGKYLAFQVKLHLGYQWFMLRPFNKKWYPKLKNLVVSSSQ